MTAEVQLTSLEGGDGVLDRSQPKSFAIGVVEAVAAILLAILVGLILVGIGFRYVLSSPLFFVEEACGFLFLWVTMLGSAIATARSEHLRLSIFVMQLPAIWQQRLHIVGLTLMAIFLAAIFQPSIERIIFESSVVSMSMGISNGYRVAALTVGIALMFVIVVSRLFRTASLPQLALSGSIIVLAGLSLWAFGIFEFQAGQASTLLMLSMIVLICLVMGVPIAFCFGLGTLCFLDFTTSIPTTVIVGRMDEAMSNLVLLSVPLFVLLGCILDSTGMGKAIVDFLASLVGHVRAGMSYVLIGSLYLVSGISGSKISDMATVAPALFPEMRRRGNKPEEMVSLLATGAIMADTVPPSIILIVIGSVAGLSIGDLFISGFVIAFVLLVALVAVARLRSPREDLAGVKRAPANIMARAALVAAPALALPFIIRSAVSGGVATASEVSAVAVLYALVVGAVLYGGIRWRTLYKMLVDTASMTGAIMLIMGTASATAWALTQTGFAQELAETLSLLPGGWIAFMLVSIATFIILGCLLEGLPAIVLMAPLMFPIAHNLGINGIHYAMVVVVSMNIGMFTPPIGIGYYIACAIGHVDPNRAMRTIWIYLLALVAGLILIAFVPVLSTGLLD